MNQHKKSTCVEYPSRNLALTKSFFEKVFGWTFQDYGPEYTAFLNEGLNSRFYLSEQTSTTENGAALLVFYSDDLEGTQVKVKAAGGIVVKSIFAFPGGRRFQFLEPSGNEFAVWSSE